MEKDRVGANNVTRIVRQIVSTMIDHGLESPDGTEKGRLTVVQTSQPKTHGKSNPVNGNRLQWVIVECPVSERHIDIMVHRMNVFFFDSRQPARAQSNETGTEELTVQPLVDVEGSMGEILKGVCQY